MASEVDVPPDLNGVAVVINADADFVDPRRLNLRVALENGAGCHLVPTPLNIAYSQVGLEIAIPASRHRALRLDRIDARV